MVGTKTTGVAEWRQKAEAAAGDRRIFNLLEWDERFDVFVPVILNGIQRKNRLVLMQPVKFRIRRHFGERCGKPGTS
jgi:hypothetical protein